MPESIAWILDFGNSVRVAIGELELVHLDVHPKLFEIPKTPHYCQHALIWQETIIPVIDMVAALQGQQITREDCYAAIIRYRPKIGSSLLFGALLLAKMPERIKVNDNLACPLPNNFKTLKSLATSCFTLNDESIPIIDLTCIFSQSAQAILSKEPKNN